MRKPGDRVIAILGRDGDVIEVFGEGVYEGHFIFPDEGPEAPVGFVADCVRSLKPEDRPRNPRIRLDNGKVVWGCECWWGSIGDERVAPLLDSEHVKIVDIDEVRSKIRAEDAKAAEAE